MRFRIIYLWFSVPALIVLLWFLAFYMPVSFYLDQQRKELASVQRTRETVESSMKDMIEVRKRDAQTRSSLDEMSRSMPLYQQFPSVIKAVAESGKKEGLIFETINSSLLPGDPQQPSSLVKPSLDIISKGRFLDICRFLDSIEKQGGFKRIADGRLSYADKDYPVLTGRFLIEFRAWKGEYSR